MSRCRSERGTAYRKSCSLDRRFDFGDPQRTEVKNGRRQHRVGARCDRRWKMRRLSSAARCDQRHINNRAYCPDHLQVESAGSAIGIHGIEEDLTNALIHAAAGPIDRIQPCGRPPAVGGHLEARGRPIRTASVHRKDQHLVAEPPGDLPDHLWPPDRPGVDRHLVSARAQQDVDVAHRADTPAHRQRNEYRLGRPAHHLERRLPALHRCRNVEEGQLVSSFGVIAGAEFHRIAGVPQRDEVDALDHPTTVHVQTRDDPNGYRHDEHSRRVNTSHIRTSSPSTPLR